MEFKKTLEKISEKDKYRFHMPGHKGRKEVFNGFEKDIAKLDFTEIEGTDNLNNPKSIIKVLQDRLRETYKVKKSYILTNGSTVGIQASILSQTNPKDKILIQRDSHKSVYNSLILKNIDSEYIWTKYNENLKLKEAINVQDVKDVFSKSDIKAVVVTYPTYYGICSDIETIAEIAHKNNAILIVDEAHGSHLKFSDNLPKAAEDLGADLVIQSFHKSLPSLTQAAVLHVCSDRIDEGKLERYLKILQTSSPSYLLMLSIESALDYMEREGRKNLDGLIDEIRKLKNKYGNGLFVKKEIVEEKLHCKYDETKLLINAYNKGLSGYSLAKKLREKHNIYVEMWDFVYNLAYISTADEIENIRYLFESTSKLDNNIKPINILDISYSIIKPIKDLSVQDAFNKKKTSILLEKSKNKISGDFIIPYPPGIPVICPGERIKGEHIRFFNNLLKENIEVLGINNSMISIVDERM